MIPKTLFFSIIKFDTSQLVKIFKFFLCFIGFKKSFTVADDVEVKGAELKDGLLKVSLERIVPKEKQARTKETS